MDVEKVSVEYIFHKRRGLVEVIVFDDLNVDVSDDLDKDVDVSGDLDVM